MQLYQSESRLWTNEVRVVYRGADQVSQLDFANGPPDFVEDSRIVSPSRQPLDRSLLKRSFNLIRELTGI